MLTVSRPVSSLPVAARSSDRVLPAGRQRHQLGERLLQAVRERDPAARGVTSAEIPQHVKDAIVAAEDRSFYENRGVSPRGAAITSLK